jgi:hypothetical protein
LVIASLEHTAKGVQGASVVEEAQSLRELGLVEVWQALPNIGVN